MHGSTPACLGLNKRGIARHAEASEKVQDTIIG